MSEINIDWSKVTLSYVGEKENAEDYFKRKISEYLLENNKLGLSGDAVLDKCINILIDMLGDEIIKSCSAVDLKKENSDYVFYFDYVLPSEPEKISVGIKLEVAE